MSHISQTEYYRSQQSGYASKYKQKKRNSKKSLPFLAKDQERAVQEDRKVLDNNIFTPAKHHWKYCGLSHSLATSRLSGA